MPQKTAVRRRCAWVDDANPTYVRYHDKEWGRPVHDDRLLFEMLTLEGAQAGLSWSTILRKRDGYRRAFANFDPRRVARFDASRRARLMRDPGIVRNRLKIDSTVTNARAFLNVQREHGSFARYLWSFVDRKPVVSRPTKLAQVPARTPLSDRISKDLKRRGFRFVGLDHHLCVPAGGRRRRRSRAGLLSGPTSEPIPPQTMIALCSRSAAAREHL